MSVTHGREVLVEGEFPFTASDFKHIAEALHNHAGIALHEGKAALVYSRLAKRVRALGLRNFAEYIALVESAQGAEERQNMTAALTTNVTRFYREPHHFDHLRDVMMPELAARARSGGRVRLWSAACSNGQEPYSMALTVLEKLPEAAELDVRILATDIDPNMVADGHAGIYSEELLAPVPPSGRRHFQPVADRPGYYGASETLRRLVTFKELNLIGDWPMRGTFDVIFCRNVVIYFNDSTQEKIWSRFAPILNTGGALYIGHSERVSGPSSNLYQTCGLTTYMRVPATSRSVA